jgi:prepilin peptidase CpaA
MSSISYGLLIALAIALLVAAFTDIRRRQIDNWLNLAIALGAPAFWWSQGLALWPDVALQFAVAAGAFAVFAALFAFKAMGGGDVKLLTALALWIPFYEYMQLLLIMSVVGGVLTIMLVFWHVARHQRDRIAVPYGVAIAVGALWTLAINYLPAGASVVQAA